MSTRRRWAALLTSLTVTAVVGLLLAPPPPAMPYPQPPLRQVPIRTAAALAFVNATQNPGIASVGGVADNLFVNFSGGTGPFTITWTGLPAGCASANAGHIVCAPSGGGFLAHYKVFVNDSAAGHVSGTGAFWISTAPIAATTLQLGSAIASIDSTFFGLNYNTFVGTWANRTLAAALNLTGVRSLRLPLLNYNFTPGVNINWTQVLTWCRWVHCLPELEVGGRYAWKLAEIQRNFANLSALVAQTGVTPALLVFGNEPDLWSGPDSTAAGYASAVANFTVARNQYFPGVPISGIEISCALSTINTFLPTLLAVDGPNLSTINVQCYNGPVGGGANGTDTAQNFVTAELTSGASYPVTIPTIRAEIRQDCPTCHITIQQGEGNPGAAANWPDWHDSYESIAANVLEAILAIQYGLTVFRIWSFVGGNGVVNCGFAVVFLAGNCLDNGPTALDSYRYYDYANLFPRLGTGSTFNVTTSTPTGVYAAAVENGSTTSVLVANTNLSVTQQLSIGRGFPVYSTLDTWTEDPADIVTAQHSTYYLAGSNSLPVLSLAPGAAAVFSFSASSSGTSGSGGSGGGGGGSGGGGTGSGGSGAGPAFPTASDPTSVTWVLTGLVVGVLILAVSIGIYFGGRNRRGSRRG